MPEEIKKEEIKQPEETIKTPDNGKEKKESLLATGEQIKPEQKLPPTEPPPTDFKIGEIWIRSGQLMLDATPEFWRDKFRARGVIAYLDDIVRDAKVPSDKPRIIPAKGNFLNGIRNLMRRK